MPSAATLRRELEAALEQRIPSALTPTPKIRSAVHPTGIEPLDDLLHGGLPQGAITEFVGPECSGRTSIALSFVSQITHQEKVCAWIDISNTLDPESAAAAGVDLSRLLWLRCGAECETDRQAAYKFKLPEKYLDPPVIKKGLHGGGFGTHPRHEIRGLSGAVGTFLQTEPLAPTCAEPQVHYHSKYPQATPAVVRREPRRTSNAASKSWLRIEQGLRSADLILQAGGFSAVVLDFGSLAPEFVSRVPLATWYRYRAAAERTQSSIVLLTQYACAKSSAELVLRLHTADCIGDEPTVFTGIQPNVEILRQRYPPETSNVISIRKHPQRENRATWPSRTSWAGAR